MRKTEDEIKSGEEIESILEQAQVCRLAMVDGKIPYIVPMNFGYEDNCLYFHGARESKKLDILRQNQEVCFEVDIEDQIVKAPGNICSWSSKYRSVIGFGKALVLDNWQEKAAALNIITRHYGAAHHDFSEKEVEKLSIIKIEISSLTGKKSGY
jgi:uncharacterized protein